MSKVNSAKSPVLRSVFDFALLAVVLVVLWQIFFEIAGSVALASPLQAAENALAMLDTSSFWMNARTTLTAFAIAVVIEAVAGLAIGIFLGLQKFAGDMFEPMMTALYSVPKLMFFPMITLFFGIGLASEVAFGVLQGIISIILFTMSAVRNIKPVYMKTGKTMNLSTMQMMLTIALPGALPEIFTGLRIGISSCLIGVILCEMFGSASGLGFILMNAMQNNIVLDISSQTLLLIIFAAGLSGVLMFADYKLHRRV
jgi:NitT/TauT family transport system permease protein